MKTSIIKKIGIPVLAALLIVGGTSTALAASPSAAGNKANPDSSQVTQSEKADTNENTILASKATITPDQAISAVKATYPDGTISGQAELNDENGTIVYQVNVTDKSGNVIDVKVDANSSKIVSSDNSADENAGTDKSEAGNNNKNDTDNVEVQE